MQVTKELLKEFLSDLQTGREDNCINRTSGIITVCYWPSGR